MRAAAMVDSLGLGGAERLLATMARHAPEVSIDLTVLSLRDVESTVVADEIAVAGAEIITVPTRWRHHLADPRRFGRLAAELRRGDFNIVHTHLGTSNVLGIAAARRVGLPAIATLHNIRLGDRGLRGRAEDAALRRADAVMAVGREVARTHAPALAGTSITVIPNPVDLPPITGTRDLRALRSELAGDADRPLLLNVGRLEPQKGQLDLLEALRHLVDDRPEVVLALAGEGRLAGALAGRARELGLDDNVRLLGPRRDLQNLLAVADVFVSSSHYEGMPLALLEAMAAGLPIVATAVGDVGDVVDGTGVLVPPREPRALAAAIDGLLGDRPRRHALGARARERVAECYDATRWMARVRELYDDTRRDWVSRNR